MSAQDDRGEKYADRVMKLVALASSPMLEEARTAAYQACALIREHKLVLRERKEDIEANWIDDLRAKREPGYPTVHITQSGHNAVCGQDLRHCVNFYWIDAIPTLKNCCLECVKGILGKVNLKEAWKKT